MTSLVTLLTTPSAAPRSLAISSSSSVGSRIDAATWSVGWAPTTKLTGSLSPRAEARS